MSGAFAATPSAPGFVARPAAGIALLLWSAEPEAPHRLATPFVHAAAAAAMEWPVEIYFAARSVRLLVDGVAAGLKAADDQARTILDTMRDAHRLGARFYACSEALVAQHIDPAALIPECDGRGGAVQFMARAGDRDWATLVF